MQAYGLTFHISAHLNFWPIEDDNKSTTWAQGVTFRGSAVEDC